MPRKSTSSTPGDMEDTHTHTQTTLSPELPDQSPSQPVSQSVQATEQQLKARAEGVSIEDYLLPRSLTLRLAKSVLPPNTSLQKDAVLAIQKAATVFVSYLSSHANEATLKRTVSPSDVFAALSELELDGFRPRLEKELDAFTELKAGKRKSKSGGSGNTSANANADGDASAVDAGTEGVAGDVAEKDGGKEKGTTSASVVRGAKRVKRDQNGNVNGNGVRDDDDEEDGDETQDEPEKVDENETEVEEEEEDEEEDEDEAVEDEQEEEDPDRVEDLDRDSRAKRTMDPDAAGDDDTESEDGDGPGSQLRGDLGLG